MVKRQRSPCFIRGLGRIAFLITRFTCDQKAGSLSRKILQKSFFSKLQRCQKTCGRLQYIAIGFGSLACEALFFTSGSYLNSSVSISMGSLKKKGWNSAETQCPLFLTSSSGLGLEKGGHRNPWRIGLRYQPLHHHDEPDQCFIFTKRAFSPPTKPRFSRGAFNKNVGMGL